MSRQPSSANRAPGALLWLVAFAGAAPPALGQVGSGQITGVVRDQAGALVSGARVIAIDIDRNAGRAVVTGSAGVYTIAGLGAGAYRLRFELDGFQTAVREGLVLDTGETLRVDVALSVGHVQERVVVAGAAPRLREAAAGLGQVVSREQIAGLPLNGRSFITLVALTPGVALPQGSQLPRINGGRPRTNEYLFDGISVLQPEPGQVAFFPVIDAIQTFKVESNSPPAEFGRFNGGVVNLTTRSGTNEVHGTVFEFFRHQGLNARHFFSSTNAVKPAFRRDQFGGTIGGPIRRDRTFFFADYQRQRQRIGRTVTSTVPTELQRQGIFSEALGGRVPVIYDPATTKPDGDGGFVRTPFPDNTIPLARMDPVALTLLQRYPLPTSSAVANNYRRTADEIDDQDQFDVKVNHAFADRTDRMFVRLSHFRGGVRPVTPLPEGSGETSGTLGPQDTDAWSLATSYQRAFGARWLNELRIGETRRAVRRSAAELDGSASISLNLPGLPATARFPNTLPTFQISGLRQLGSPANTASDFSTGVAEIADSLIWLKGRHAVKSGFDFRWERLNVIQPPSPTGSFQFSSLFTDLPNRPNTGTPLASFLLGQVQIFSIDLQQREIQNRARFQEYFVQDDWKVSERWTIAPGVRYTLNFPSVEKNDQAAIFNLETRSLDYLGRDGVPRTARQLHKLNFGPRLGIVGRLSDRTVVSTGYGLVWIEQAGMTTPFTTPVFPFLQTLSQRALDNITPAFVLSNGPSVEPIPLTPLAGLGQGVFAVDRDLGSGYVQQWNSSLQRSVGSDTSIEVAYVGSTITHAGIPDTNLNQLTVQQLTLGAALQERVPNPFFGTIPRSSSLGDPTITRAQLLKPYPQYTSVSLYRNNVGTTRYQGVTAKLERRLSHGLAYLISYTRSKLVDDASSVFDASILTGPVANYPVADSFNRRLERDYSTGDIPHVLVSSFAWDVHEWALAGIVTLQSGIPVTVTQATNFNAFAGFGIQRPNLVGEPDLPASERDASRWFNTSAFASAAPFTLGTSSRNPVRGPSYRNVDVAVSRRVRAGGTAVMELRGEVFNLLNTPALGTPNAVLGAANFGTITTAGDPRVAQLVLKLIF